MIDESRILFVTTSLRTRWECYSQVLIRKAFPRSPRLVIDGRTDWHPAMFIDRVPWSSYSYVILVDEDCFVSGNCLRSVVEAMELRPNTAIAGVPDGGFFYREHNPYACNLFLLVVKSLPFTSVIDKHPNWQTYQFDPRYRNMPLPSWIDSSRVQFADFEPYYGIFWALQKEGLETLTLEPTLNSRCMATDVHFEGRLVATHMWYLRNWWDRAVMPGHNMPNRERYRFIERTIRDSFSLYDRLTHAQFEACRLADGSLDRMRRAFSA